MPTIKLEMICTGEEVLSGQILDTNAAWFADTMMNHGIEMQLRTTVGDRIGDLAEIFSARSQHAEMILVNGGLGPTTDDLSAEAIALALGEELIQDLSWRRHLEEWFEKRGQTMPASNLKQCYIPKSAILVDNPVGSAPGFRVKLNQAWLFFTPGVPFEFKQMVEEQFIPFIKHEFNITEPSKLIKLLTIGHGESLLADKLEQLTLPPNITIGYRSSMPHIEIKLFARGEHAITALPNFTSMVKECLGNALVSEQNSSIAEEVHQLLTSKLDTLSIAESCTGGMLSSQLIDFPGSSHYFLQGVVTYSNVSKTNMLNITPDTLKKYGAVSIETAYSMACNVRRLSNSVYGLATTGIAGPAAGNEEKPAGTVVIALSTENQCSIQTLHFNQRSRNLVRLMSCAVALDMLRRKILGQKPIVDYPFIKRIESRTLNELD